jgi:hypothetical protein
MVPRRGFSIGRDRLYVAAFFAVAEAEQDQKPAIWAIDTNAVESEAMNLLIEDGSLDESVMEGYGTGQACEEIDQTNDCAQSS